MINTFPYASDFVHNISAYNPNDKGRFGNYGGRVVPEALVPVIDEVTYAFEQARNDQDFLAKLNALQSSYTGRPSPLYKCQRLSDTSGTSFASVAGADFYLKREDLNHTGSHKINNVLGQVLLAQTMGKKRVIAETGAGQHGVATATACALFGVECVIYMGSVDVERQALNVTRMRLLGATVISVSSGSATLKDAITEAMRDWVAHADTTYYCFGTAAGPHPFPLMVRDFQRIIGAEARQQILENIGSLPNAVVACIGGGSNAIGAFHAFLDDDSVQLFGCEAGGDGIATSRHAASISGGTPGYLHGAYSYLLQDDDGQIIESHSISAGLDYPGVGPEHAHLADIGRVKYFPVTDNQAMEAFGLLSRKEGIIPAIESAHAVAGALLVAAQLVQIMPNPVIIINISGRGDKDVATAGKWFGLLTEHGELSSDDSKERKI